MYFSIDYVSHLRYIDSQPRSWRGVSRRSTHPAIWDERSKKCNPASKNARRGNEEDWLFDIVRWDDARFVLILRSAYARWHRQREQACAALRAAPQHEGRRGRRISDETNPRRGHARPSHREPTCTCGRVGPIVLGLLFTMKIPIQTCDSSARGAGTGTSGIRRCCAPAGKA
jgi:hypothetical protein